MIVSLLILFIITFVAFFTLLAGINGAPSIPAPKSTVKKMVDLMKVKSGDIYYDLGSGDGRILEEIIKRGGIAIGFEYAPLTYLYSKIRLLLTNKKGGEIFWRNFYKQNLSEASGIFCYLMPRPMVILEPKFQKELKKDTKVVSYVFKMPNKKPEKVVKLKGRAPIYVYEY